MKSPATSALAACLGLCLASLVMAQDRNPKVPPATMDRSLFADSVGLQYQDGQLWAGGRDFKVLFEQDWFTYTPALGARAPRNYPLTMRVEACGRGATRTAVGPAELTATDQTARYRRREFTETCEIRPEGIKQSFVFDRLSAGTGDLVVRTRIETDLQPSQTGLVEDSLSFLIDDLGGVDIGAVIGVDGKGTRAKGSMHYEQGVLEMRLPAAFVEQATLPLVLDPVIGPNIWIRVTGDENLDPDVAFDFTNDLYLVVFERRFSLIDALPHQSCHQRGPVASSDSLLDHRGARSSSCSRAAGAPPIRRRRHQSKLATRGPGTRPMPTATELRGLTRSRVVPMRRIRKSGRVRFPLRRPVAFEFEATRRGGLIVAGHECELRHIRRWPSGLPCHFSRVA